MAYTPQTWVDNNASYPLSAARMNTMESGISSAASVADQGHMILTTAQRDALGTVTTGTMIYNSTTQRMEIYIGTGWVPIGGSLVFTNEAARDAAITAPSEGMQVYLTAPTEPAATGMTITGIRQIYDGAAWTTVSLLSGLVDTGEVCTSATYADLATVGPVVTIRTGVSAIVTMSVTIDTKAANRGGTMSFAVSGASTIAAADGTSVFAYSLDGDVFVAVSRTLLVTGLTAGLNTFTAKYKQQGGNTDIYRRSLSVTGTA